jgi:hypothetical protein
LKICMLNAKNKEIVNFEFNEFMVYL